MNFSGLSKYSDVGLLLLRVGIGAMMIMHGWPKLVGGPERWEGLGSAMQHVGIHFFPVFWGFMAAISETIGGALLVVGFLFRPASALLFATMVVAATMKFRTGDGAFMEWAWPAEMAIVFLSMILIGPGRYSVDRA